MDERPAPESLRDMLLVVLHQWRVVLGVYAAVLAIAGASIFVIAPRYRAASKVLVTSNRALLSTSAEKPTELIRSSQLAETEVNSQIEILRSRSLIEAVLKAFHREEQPAENPGRMVRTVRTIVGVPMALARAAYHRLHRVGPEPIGPLYWQVEAVRDSLEVGALKNSNVIEIGYRSGDPAWARELVERLTAAYVDRQAKLQRESEAEAFFTQQSEILRQKLADSEAALRARREEVGALVGQESDVHERLNEFDAEFARTRVARAEQEQRVAFLQQVEQRHGGRTATPELLQLEAKRAELIGRYRPDSVRVRDVDDQIQRLRTAVTAYGTVVGGSEPGAAAAVDATAARAALQALKGKEEALGRQRDEYRRQAELLDGCKFDLARLERQAKLDEEAYLSYVRTAEQSRLSNALEQSKVLRLTVVEPAAVGAEPVSPQKGRILLFALIGGLALGVGAGIARDRLEGTVKTAEDVRRYARLDVLAVLPDRS